MIVEASGIPSGFVARATCEYLLMKVKGIERTHIPLFLEDI